MVATREQALQVSRCSTYRVTGSGFEVGFARRRRGSLLAC